MNLAPPPSAGGDGPQSLSHRLRAVLKRRLSRYLHEPKELLWNPRYVKKELALLAPDPPDVLLVRDHLMTSSCPMVARRLSRPLVLEVNAPAADESQQILDAYWHLPGVSEWLDGWKLRRADAVTVVSTALKEYLVERYRLPSDKIAVVPNGADVARFRPDVACDAELPEAFQQGLVVGFVGSFHKWHGTELLAHMTREVGRGRDQVRFLFVGDGPEAEAVRRDTEALGERVRFTGRVPHERVPGLVAGFDIGVVAQTGFYMSPLKVMEWMAAGRAVVAPRYGPLEEVIEDGVEGLLFPPGDREALVEAVLRLVDEPALRQQLGQAAAERAHSSLSWDDNARRVIAACEQAIGRHGDPAR